MQLPETLLFKEWAAEKESENKKEQDQTKREEDGGRECPKSIKRNAGGGKMGKHCQVFHEKD